MPVVLSFFTKGTGNLEILTEHTELSPPARCCRRPAYILFLDAKSAFDAVLPELLIRNMYMAGMDGNSTVLVNNRLVNRQTILEWDRTLMGPIKDELGLEQGGANSSDYYKLYSNENLDTAQESRQGIELGSFLGRSRTRSSHANRANRFPGE